jgi:hypothetical protein
VPEGRWDWGCVVHGASIGEPCCTAAVPWAQAAPAPATEPPYGPEPEIPSLQPVVETSWADPASATGTTYRWQWWCEKCDRTVWVRTDKADSFQAQAVHDQQHAHESLLDPDECPHEHFGANVEISRLTDVDDGPVVGYNADVTAWCAQCGVALVWFGNGLPVGMVRDRPAISVNGQEIHLPCRPANADPNTGLGLAGFVMRAEMGAGDATN